MVKKLCALLLILLLPLTALAAEKQIYDNCGLFKSLDEVSLTQHAARLEQQYGMEFLILTDDGAEYSSDDDEAERNSLAFANSFYARGGFGLDAEQSGFLFFIDMSNRVPTVYTYGKMIDYLDDERLATLLDRVYNELYAGDYAGAADLALSLVERYLAAGIPEGQYRYDVVTGQMLTARHKALTTTEIMGAFLVGLAVALIAMKSVTASYKLKGGAYAYNVGSNSAVEMLDSADDYLTSTVSSVRRPKNTSSGGGGSSRPSGGTRVHSSGGRSFGGGSGRRF